MITETTLNTYLRKHIREICTVGYTSDSDNHCAHFVSHVLGFQFGTTCAIMANGKGTPGCIRVDEVFGRCLQVGRWDQIPAPLISGLAFVLNAGNVHLERRVMDRVPTKHVGIFCGATRMIWHYSNQQRKVICQTPEQFKQHYGPPNDAMFWGRVP